MAGTNKWFGLALVNALGGETEAKALDQTDFLTDDIKVALLTVAPDQDADQYWADVSGDEASATTSGYTSGGESLTTKTLAYDGASNKIKLNADDVEWPDVVGSLVATHAVIYNNSSTNKVLLGFVDLGGEQTATDGAFKLTWDNINNVMLQMTVT